MKLEWMSLTNFRQFYGDQTIHFSRHQRQNVTVVHGANGSGKTSLFTALNWCLYGLGVEDMGELVSKQAIMEAAVDEEIEMKVQLAFSHSGERLTATRALSVSKTSSQRWQTKPQTEFSLDSIRSDGQTRRIPNPTGYVESILPSNVRTYFFFDGEKIDQFTRPSHEAEVREAVRNVLKIEVLERAKNHLGVVAREYQSELKKLASGGIEDLLDKEEKLRNEAENIQQSLIEFRKEEVAAKRQMQEIDVKLGEIREIREWDDKRKVAVEESEVHEQEKDRLWEEIKEKSNQGFLCFANEAISKALEVLEAMRERGEIPPGIREQFVNDLLAAHRCICGRSIEEESEEYCRLMEVLARSLPSELENVVLQTAGDLRAVQPRVEDVDLDLRKLMRRKAEIDHRLEGLAATLDEVSRHLQGVELEEVSALEIKRMEYERKIRALGSDIGRFEERLDNRRADLDKLQSAIDKAQLSEKRAQDMQRRFSLARKASDAVEGMEDAFARDMRANIQTEAKEAFRCLVWKESQFQDVQLSEDYHLEVIDRWGLPARPELSAGERQVLSLAFITGMAKVTGEEAPLVMDTPFGRLSSAHREAITRHVPDLTDQLVIFVTDEELHSKARDNLKHRIGAEYKLTFDQNTGSSTIEELATRDSQQS